MRNELGKENVEQGRAGDKGIKEVMADALVSLIDTSFDVMCGTTPTSVSHDHSSYPTIPVQLSL